MRNASSTPPSSPITDELTGAEEQPRKPLVVRQFSESTAASSVQDLVMPSSPSKRKDPPVLDVIAKHGSPPSQPASKEKPDRNKNKRNTMKDQAHLNIIVICMVLAYTRMLDESENICHVEPVLAKTIVDMGSNSQNYLKPKIGRPYPADIWDTWTLISEFPPNFEDDLCIHILERDSVCNEFVYSILHSQCADTVYVVFGAKEEDQHGLGQRMTRLLPGSVDGLWGDGSSLVGHLKRFIQYSLKSPKTIVVCGHGGGGALAAFIGALLTTTTTPMLKPLQIWTYGAPKVGDATFRKIHRQMEHQGRLHHLRFVNQGDSIPMQPNASWDVWYRSVGSKIVLPFTSKTTCLEHSHSLFAYLQRVQEWKCHAPSLENWQTQQKIQDRQRTNKNQRFVMILSCILLIYGPLVYLASSWNHSVTQEVPAAVDIPNVLLENQEVIHYSGDTSLVSEDQSECATASMEATPENQIEFVEATVEDTETVESRTTNANSAAVTALGTVPWLEGETTADVQSSQTINPLNNQNDEHDTAIAYDPGNDTSTTDNEESTAADPVSDMHSRLVAAVVSAAAPLPAFIIMDSPASHALVHSSCLRQPNVPLFNIGMTFQPPQRRLLTSVSSGEYGISLILARSSRRRIKQMLNMWEKEIFYQRHLRDHRDNVFSSTSFTTRMNQTLLDAI